METVDYRITEGGDYGWECYGPDAHMLDSWNGNQDGHSFTIIFDTKTQEVYEVQAHDYVRTRAYRMVNPDFKKKLKKEAKRRDVNKKEAWDDVNYIDLEVDDDFISKCLAIKNNEDYDTRVSMPIDIPDDELLLHMKKAHKMDITFNSYVEMALEHAIEKHSIE